MVTMPSNKILCSISMLHQSCRGETLALRLDTEKDRPREPRADLQCCKVKDLYNPKSVGLFD